MTRTSFLPRPLVGELKSSGLGQCARCGRIVLTERLEKGRCRERGECSAAVVIRGAAGDEEFVRGVERGMREATNG